MSDLRPDSVAIRAGRNDNGSDVASGLYLGQVEVGGRRKTFKMAVLK